MDITPYVSSLQRDLAAAAQVGDEQTQIAVERLSFAIEPAMRLAIIEALSQAATELTAALPHTSVELRIADREPHWVVEAIDTPHPITREDSDDGDLARVTVRLPATLKSRADTHASSAGQSLNAWIVDAIRAALTPTPSSAGRRNAKRLSGWA